MDGILYSSGTKFLQNSVLHNNNPIKSEFHRIFFDNNLGTLTSSLDWGDDIHKVVLPEVPGPGGGPQLQLRTHHRPMDLIQQSVEVNVEVSQHLFCP